MSILDRIEEIDKILFDAGVLILGAKTVKARKDADHKVMDARIKLENLRSRFE